MSQLHRHPEHRGSSLNWLGEGRAGWPILRVKQVFTVVNGATPSSSEGEYWDGDIPWVTPEDLGRLRDQHLSASARLITRTGYNSCGTTLVPPGSIVLSTRAPIGHLALATRELCTNQGCRSLVARRPAEASYFYYELLAAKPELESWGQGSTFKELGKSHLEAVSIIVPPIDEQRAIAAFLDRETAKIDALIAKEEQLIELLQEKRTGLISRVVTKGLDPNAPMKDSEMEWLGAIPTHWSTRRIKWVARMESGHTPDKKVEDYWLNGDIPWVSLADTGRLREGDYIAETTVLTTAQGIAHSSARILPSGTVCSPEMQRLASAR